VAAREAGISTGRYLHGVTRVRGQRRSVNSLGVDVTLNPSRNCRPSHFRGALRLSKRGVPANNSHFKLELKLKSKNCAKGQTMTTHDKSEQCYPE
jgi:hypothetical protein